MPSQWLQVALCGANLGGRWLKGLFRAQVPDVNWRKGVVIATITKTCLYPPHTSNTVRSFAFCLTALCDTEFEGWSETKKQRLQGPEGRGKAWEEGGKGWEVKDTGEHGDGNGNRQDCEEAPLMKKRIEILFSLISKMTAEME